MTRAIALSRSAYAVAEARLAPLFGSSLVLSCGAALIFAG